MNKYINIIIFTFCTLMLGEYNLGFTFFIPVAVFFGLKNVRNLIIIFLTAAVMFFFDLSFYIVPAIILFSLIVLYYFTFQKLAKTPGNLIFCLLSTIITGAIIIGINDIFLLVFYAIVATFLLAYLYFNQDSMVSSNLAGFGYNELMLALIATVGATTMDVLSINLGLAIGIYFAIYFASANDFGKSIVFNLISMVGLKYMFGIDQSYLIFLVSSFYYLPKILSTISLFAFVIFIYLSDSPLLSPEIVQAIMIIGLFFEVFRFSLINKINTDIFVDNIYENIIKNVNTEVMSFATFLDYVNKDFSYSKDYYNRLREAISSLYKKGCEPCSNRKDCLNRNKGKLYYYYKSLIIYQYDENFTCVNYNELKKTAYQISNKFNLIEKTEQDEMLASLTSGFSTILRQISVDANAREEMDYKMIIALKEDLINFGFSVTFFNPRSVFLNNFLIEVGIYDIDFEEYKDKIMKIAHKTLGQNVSLLFKKFEKNKVYFNIIPEIKFDVAYGYGALAPLGNNICGDNYMVKQLGNSKLIAAISDGMGKGIKASIQSNLTLQLIDKITNMNIMSETALQILNTLIYIQDYQESYATLDFVEIDRQKGEGVFYKAGGTTTYLFHNDGSYKKIENKNLPFGLEEIININKEDLKDGDLIIIGSDGIFENIIDNNSFEKFISESRYLEPQKLIYELLNYVRYNDVVTKDDMSLIALKIKAS